MFLWPIFFHLYLSCAYRCLYFIWNAIVHLYFVFVFLCFICVLYVFANTNWTTDSSPNNQAPLIARCDRAASDTLPGEATQASFGCWNGCNLPISTQWLHFCEKNMWYRHRQPPKIGKYVALMVKIVVWDLPLPVSPLFKAIQMALVSAAPATAPHKLPQSTIIRRYANMVRIGVYSVANSESVRLICCCCTVQTPLKLPMAPHPLPRSAGHLTK